MSFKMRCPKCGSMSYSVERDTRTYSGAKAGELVFSCRCGKQLYADQLEAEHNRQKAEWDADPERQRMEREREERRREIEARDEQLRQALEYRRAWVQQKRAEKGVPGAPPAPPPPRPAPPPEPVAARKAPEPAAAPTPPPAPAAPPPAEAVSAAELEAESADIPDSPQAVEPREGKCEWLECNNQAAPNSKYCCRACSNKNARWRHAQRKKGDVAA
jgi:hypothetical protein